MNRELRAEERAVLDAMLAFDFEGSTQLRQQSPLVRVVGKCECGCATVHLSVDRSAAPASVPYRPIPVTAIANDEKGKPTGHVLVFADEGYLSALEIAWFTDEPIREFPPLDQIDLSPEY